ncbi:mitochondrial-processing peptidase subunit, partial [Musa troglodytarum]
PTLSATAPSSRRLACSWFPPPLDPAPGERRNHSHYDPIMYRVAVSRLRALEHHARATRYASTSVAKRSSGGFFSWLTGEQSSQLPPLDFPLPGVMLPPPLPDHVEPGKTKVTTLPNGVKIASETSPNPAVSLGLYVDCGSVYETPLSSGATHLLELMAFKSTTNRSHLRIVREVEAIGGNVMASASREQMGYTYDALKTYMPEMVEVLVDCVRNPAFLDWEVNEQLQKVKAEIGEISKNPQGLLLEAIHSAGYSGALANPLMASESAINRLNSTILEEFAVENYTAPRMVLAASGVEHEELVSIAEPLLSDLPNVPCPEEPKSIYVGGDYRCQADSDKTHVALAFEVPGGWRQEKDAMTLTVIQMLMGGGDSFSAGGPGKGMYSRLYLRVLNEHQQIQSFSAFNSIYNNTGIFGIHATTSSDFVSKAIDLAIRELLAIATPGQVDQLQLDRAKESTKSAVLMNLESRMVASEDIGRQILTYGESHISRCEYGNVCIRLLKKCDAAGMEKPIEHFLKAIDKVTLKDITTITEKIISSPLTMASWGDGMSNEGIDQSAFCPVGPGRVS